MSDLRDELPILRAASADESMPPVPTPIELSVGQMLQQARQARGWSLEAVSERMKVSVKRLAALEADQFETGPALQVGRAMVASLARQLGLNPQDLLAKMPEAPSAHIVPTPQQSPGSYRTGGQSSSRSGGGQLMPRLWWLTALFLVLAGLVFLMPYAQQWVAPTPPVPSSVAPAPSIPPQVPESATSTPTPEASAFAGAQSSASATASPSSAAVVPTPPASTPAALATASAPALPLIAFKAHGPTWVEVIDASGQVLLRRTLANSESVQTGGALPLSVVVGRADHTEVTVRSIPFPLDTVTTENVARFKVQ